MALTPWASPPLPLPLSATIGRADPSAVLGEGITPRTSQHRPQLRPGLHRQNTSGKPDRSPVGVRADRAGHGCAPPFADTRAAPAQVRRPAPAAGSRGALHTAAHDCLRAQTHTRAPAPLAVARVSLLRMRRIGDHPMPAQFDLLEHLRQRCNLVAGRFRTHHTLGRRCSEARLPEGGDVQPAIGAACDSDDCQNDKGERLARSRRKS